MQRCLQNLAIRPIGSYRFTKVSVKNCFIKVLLDFCMHLIFSRFIQALNTLRGKRILPIINKRMSSGVKHIVAEKSCNIGASDRNVFEWQRCNCVSHRKKKFGRFFFMHDRRIFSVAMQQRICCQIKQRIWTLVAQQKSFSLFHRRKTKFACSYIKGILAKEVMSQNCGHVHSFQIATNHFTQQWLSALERI